MMYLVLASKSCVTVLIQFNAVIAFWNYKLATPKLPIFVPNFWKKPWVACRDSVHKPGDLIV